MSATPPPEEIELERKRSSLRELEADLTQRELDLATLRNELTFFEALYVRTVGLLYSRLDEVEARIAEAVARRRPSDLGAQDRATQARARARESAEAALQAGTVGGETRFKASDNLKRLFREVAKRVHPDLATDPAEAARRQQVMAAANEAYAAGDEARLQAILDEWESGPESVKGEDAGAELVRTIRRIAQVERRLQQLHDEFASLRDSELFQLKTRVEQAESEGRDLLSELAARAKQDLASAEGRLREAEHG